ncbi:hypothetical protein HYT00_01250 [Candidatus Giovannonibacteria bacterium]|nr:hypothetical protein [Candidatus Giovannonibacteria bacterium]
MKSSRKLMTVAMLMLLSLLAENGNVVNKALASTAAAVSSPYFYNFNVAGTLEEASPMNSSTSPYWWLNSGGLMYLKDGVGQTVQGNLASTNKWRLLYASSNPVDTDNGYHPQNLFRLVTRNKWQNFSQQAYFKITRNNLSASSNRNQSNGFLLMNRYAADGQTLYYAGIRVDGYAVIKKKYFGSYTTLKLNKIFPGTWDRNTHPNLITENDGYNKWYGLKTVVQNMHDGRVHIQLYLDSGRTGTWKLVADAYDTSSVISGSNYAGIRTDFMDVIFEDYKMVNL